MNGPDENPIAREYHRIRSERHARRGLDLPLVDGIGMGTVVAQALMQINDAFQAFEFESDDAGDERRIALDDLRPGEDPGNVDCPEASRADADPLRVDDLCDIS